MIKKIKEIDLQGNITIREVMVCNKCGEVLEGEDFVFTLQPSFRQVNPKKILDMGGLNSLSGTFAVSASQNFVRLWMRGNGMSKFVRYNTIV